MFTIFVLFSTFFDKVYGIIRGFTKFSNFHQVWEIHQVFTRFKKNRQVFTRFSPSFWNSPSFHRVFTRFMYFTKFSPGLKISPSFHHVFEIHQVFTRFMYFTKFSPGLKISPGFHQVFTKFRNFTRFSPSFGNFTVISWISPGFHQVFFSQHCIQISPWKLFFFTKFTMKTLLFLILKV